MAIKKQKLLTEQDYKKKIDKARNSNKDNLDKKSQNLEDEKFKENIEKGSYLYIFKYISYFIIFTLIILFIIAPKPKTYYYFSNNIEQQSIFIPSSIFNKSFILDSTYFDKISLKEIEKEKFLVLCSTDKSLKCQQYKITKEDSLITTLKRIKNNYFEK